jgi:allophanate hydrolase subunit 2
MILVQEDVWRADCIAAIGWDEDKVVQVYPLNSVDFVEYEWNTHYETARAYRSILEAWKRELGV